MKIYKKLFVYVQDKKYLGFLAIIFSAISAVLIVYGYYLIYKNLIEKTKMAEEFIY